MAKPTIYKSQDTKVSKTQREVYNVSDTERTKIRTIVDAFKVNFLAANSETNPKCSNILFSPLDKLPNCIFTKF